MARSQSPGYPNYGLPKALQYVERIFNADRRNPIDRETAVKHMGYSGLSGASDKALGSLGHFGLVERVGKGEVCVSQLAVDILHPQNDTDKRRALLGAAFSPSIFKDLRERFKDGHVSESALQSYLKRENFLDRAINPVTTAYLETLRYLEREKAFESGGVIESTPPESTVPEDSDQSNAVFGGAEIGDLIQWEVDGVLRLEKPTRVRAVSQDGLWLFVDGSRTGIPMNQVLVEQRGKPPENPSRQPPMLPLENETTLGGRRAMRREIIDLDEGEAVLTYPVDMSLESFKDLEDQIAIVLRKLKRRAQTERDLNPGDGMP